MLKYQTYSNREKTQGGCGGGSKSATPVGGETVTDPVRGMNVDPGALKPRLEQGGQT